jgi:rare lipoprotein A
LLKIKDLEQVRDAILNKRTMKNLLKILTLSLLFTTSLIAQDEEFGLASYYSDLFHGKPTASGELYDKTKLTCAHKTLPFGTMLRVTRLDNNKSVQVKVTDRGPFISGRVVEVSRAGAEALGLIQDGSTRVKVEVVKPDLPAVVTTETVKPESTPPTPEPEKPTPPVVVDPTPKKPTTSNPPSATVTKSEPKPTTAPAPSNPSTTSGGTAVLVKGSDFQPFDLFQIELKSPEKKGFGVQVAVLSTQEALFKKIGELQEDWFSSILVSVQKNSKGDMIYKVILGSFATENEASNYKDNLKKNKKIKGFVVDLATMGSNN